MMAVCDDFGEAGETLDLNQLCIQHPTACYFVRASDDAMIDAGIHCDDVLVVDRSLKARDGDIIIASLDHSLTVRKFQIKPVLALVPMNSDDRDYQIKLLDKESMFEIVGVVTYVIHAVR